MMNSRFLFAAGLALTVSIASAATPVGSWTGKVIVTKMPAMPANLPPQQKAMMQQAMAMASQVHLQLTLKADKTYTLKYTGIPGAEKQPPHVGTWSQKGNVVTTTSKSVKGPAQQLILSADGKTMSMNAPNGSGKVVFTR